MSIITVSEGRAIALRVNRVATKEEHFVYIAIANKLISYPSGAKSKIVYIGQTRKGVSRLLSSATKSARKLLPSNKKKGTPRITSLTYYIVVPRKTQGTQSWKLLETALLSEFKLWYGDVPKANVQGKKYNFDVPAVIHARNFFTPGKLKTI